MRAMRENQTYVRLWKIEVGMGKADFTVDFWTDISHPPIYFSSLTPLGSKGFFQIKKTS